MLPVWVIQRLKALSVISDCFDHKVNLLNRLTNYWLLVLMLPVSICQNITYFCPYLPAHGPAQLTKSDLQVNSRLI